MHCDIVIRKIYLESEIMGSILIESGGWYILLLAADGPWVLAKLSQIWITSAKED